MRKISYKANKYVPLNNLFPNFVALFVFTETVLSVISCISSADSSPNLFFYQFFDDETRLPAKNFMPSDICRINFRIRSNTSTMAGNLDTANQSES